MPQLGFEVGVFYADLLASACAEQRVWGIERWSEYGGESADLLPLLDDDAPVVRTHAGDPVLVEVRASALVALQDWHRGVRHSWPYGPVTVRRAMPVTQALAQAELRLTRLEPARVDAIDRPTHATDTAHFQPSTRVVDDLIEQIGNHLNQWVCPELGSGTRRWSKESCEIR